MSTTILAIDLGKFNSVLCWYEPTTKDTAFRTVRTSADELRKELTRQTIAQVVFEACSQAGWVHDLCVELQLKPLVASTTGGRLAVEARQTQDRPRRRPQARSPGRRRRDRRRARGGAGRRRLGFGPENTHRPRHPRVILGKADAR